MPSPFEIAIAVVLRHEGGYVNHPADPGGATNFGVSLRTLSRLGGIDPDDGKLLGDMDGDGVIDAEDIRLLTRDEAVKIYRTQWWDRFGYGRIADPDLACKVFDFSVNMGASRAHKLLQKAVNATSPVRLAVDGVLGPMSLAIVNGHPEPRALLGAYRQEAVTFYRSLNRPQFLKGWIRRAMD